MDVPEGEGEMIMYALLKLFSSPGVGRRDKLPRQFIKGWEDKRGGRKGMVRQ